MIELLEEYKKILDCVEKQLENTKEGENHKIVRLTEKRACYRQFIGDLTKAINTFSHELA